MLPVVVYASNADIRFKQEEPNTRILIRVSMCRIIKVVKRCHGQRSSMSSRPNQHPDLPESSAVPNYRTRQGFMQRFHRRQRVVHIAVIPL